MLVTQLQNPLSHWRVPQPPAQLAPMLQMPQAPPPVPRQFVSLSRQTLLLQQPPGHDVGLHGWQAPPAHPLGQNEVLEPYVQPPPEHVPDEE